MAKIKISDLVEEIYNNMDDEKFSSLSASKKKSIANETVDLFFNTIKKSIQQGNRVELRGFATFTRKDYDGYVGRNPKTGEKVQVASKRLPVFRPAKTLIDLINQD